MLFVPVYFCILLYVLHRAALVRGRCISCILCKVERICLNCIKGKDYYYYYYYYLCVINK